MAKIQPLPAATSSPCSSSEDYKSLQGEKTQKQVVYTVWMKSLVFNGNGCTVYGSDGRVAFRVDNYGCKGSREVFFMDRAGKALIRIQRKVHTHRSNMHKKLFRIIISAFFLNCVLSIVLQSFGMFKRWEACRCYDGGEGFGEETRPWFRVQRAQKSGATVTLHGSGRTYRIDGCSRKSDCRISGADGAVVAEIGRKQTASGVVLGSDVLTLTVGPEEDHLLVLVLVVVCGLMNRSM